jgi:hypothetical protein
MTAMVVGGKETGGDVKGGEVIVCKRGEVVEDTSAWPLLPNFVDSSDGAGEDEQGLLRNRLFDHESLSDELSAEV